jgi:uncharacterized membrane protein
MILALHLKVCGALLIALAALHPAIAKKFQWKEELAGVSLLTRQIFWVHTLFIGLILVQFGVLSLAFTHALLERTFLARIVLGGLVMFWGVRLFAQHFIYSPKIWRGHRFNTTMHVLFTGLWTYFVLVYGAALWLQYRN